jgi:hypothetical protein
MERTIALASAIKQFKLALQTHLSSQPNVDQIGVDRAVRNIMNLTLNALVQESENLDKSMHEVVRIFKTLTSISLHEMHNDVTLNEHEVQTAIYNVEKCLSKSIDSEDWSLVVEALEETHRIAVVFSDSSWSDHATFVWDFED